MTLSETVEPSEKGYNTLPLISEDGIGFKMIIPTNVAVECDRKEHFEIIQPLLDKVSSTYIVRKNFSEKFRKPWYKASFDCLQNTTYVSFFTKDSDTPVGGIRLIRVSGNRPAGKEKSFDDTINILGVQLKLQEAMEIGAFFIENNLPVLVRKRILAEVWFAVLYWYKNVSNMKSFAMLIYADTVGAGIFRSWGFRPVRKYRDVLLGKDVLFSDGVPDKMIIHRSKQETWWNKDTVILQCRINEFTDYTTLLRRISGYCADDPVVHKRLKELGLEDLKTNINYKGNK